MGFDEAHAHLKAGRSIYRQDWIFNRPRITRLKIVGGITMLVTHQKVGRSVAQWKTSGDEQLAEDWKIYE